MLVSRHLLNAGLSPSMRRLSSDFAEPAGGAANFSKRVVLPRCSASEFPMVNAT
jgi:hypothetical protein